MSDQAKCSAQPPVPKCQHWLLGDIEVADGPKNEQLTKYPRAVLVSFETVDEYRAALRFMSPILEGPQEHNGG